MESAVIESLYSNGLLLLLFFGPLSLNDLSTVFFMGLGNQDNYENLYHVPPTCTDNMIFSNLLED